MSRRPVGDRSPRTGRSTGFQDVVPGEGGETSSDTISTGDTDTVDYSGLDDSYDPSSSAVGATSGVSSMTLEVSLLSLDAADRVAQAIAGRVAVALGEAKVTGVALATPELLAALRLHAAIAAELGALETQVAAAAADPPAVTSDDIATTAFALPVAALALQGVKRAAQSASAALSVFAVTTRYTGRKDTVAIAQVDAALAKHLAAAAVPVRLPAYVATKPTINGLLGRALALQQACRTASAAGTSNVTIDTAGQVVDALLAAIFGSSGSDGDGGARSASLAPQLMLADTLAAALAANFALLSVELAASGGSYRTRRWLLNFLTGSDGLTYSGGAAITYFLFAPDGLTALASDTLYFTSGHGRFASTTRSFSTSNIAVAPRT